jgi:hypothetical protein
VGQQIRLILVKAGNLLDALHKAPFRPFDLHLDNGRVIRIKHPDLVFFNESKTTAVIADGEHLHIVDLDHVSNLALAIRR